VLQWYQNRIAKMLALGAGAAATKMLELIDSDSSRTSFESSRFVLGLSGFRVANDPGVQVNVVQATGFCIDLTGKSGRPGPVVRHESGAGVVVMPAKDDKVIEGTVIDVKPGPAPAGIAGGSTIEGKATEVKPE
jgi:hypothetical protein